MIWKILKNLIKSGRKCRYSVVSSKHLWLDININKQMGGRDWSREKCTYSCAIIDTCLTSGICILFFRKTNWESSGLQAHEDPTDYKQVSIGQCWKSSHSLTNSKVSANTRKPWVYLQCYHCLFKTTEKKWHGNQREVDEAQGKITDLSHPNTS